MRGLGVRLASVWGAASAGAVVAGLLIVVGFVVARFALGPGGRALLGGGHDLSEMLEHLLPALAGTGLLVLVASVVAVPLGVGTGIYLAEYAGARAQRLFGTAVDFLAGIPSVVMGLFGFSIVVTLRHLGVRDARTCLLSASLALALLVLPYLARATQSALEGLPGLLRLTGHALGFSKWQILWSILLPAARRGVLAGLVLAVGRIAEDTAVILLTGAVANAGVPTSLLQKFEALPFLVFFRTSEHRTAAEMDEAFGAALALLVLTTLLFGFAYWVHRRLPGAPGAEWLPKE